MAFAKDLRASVLQAAMQGKLTEQLTTDTPVSELLADIKAEKDRLITEKKIKKEKPLSAIVEDDIPFDIPENWVYVRVGDIISNRAGLSYNKENLTKKSDNMVRVLRGGNIFDGTYSFKTDDVMIDNSFVKSELFLNKNTIITPAVTSLEHIGKMARIEKSYTDTVVGGFVLMLTPHLDNDILSQYLLFTFLEPSFRDRCRNITNKSGQAFYNLSRQKLMELVVPLPPIEEQKRIVRRIDEIMTLIDELEAIEEELTKLKQVFPGDMKNAILQAAMQGKLTEQLETDSSVDELLEDIKKERERLVKEGKIKKSKTQQNDNFVAFNDGEEPFEIPDNWKWMELGRITYNHGQKTPDSSFSYIDIGSIDNVKQTLNEKENIIEASKAPSRARKIVCQGDILYSTVRPYLHNMCVVGKNFSKEPIASTGFAVMKCNAGILNKYLFYYLMSPNFDAYANAYGNAKGLTYPAINDEKLYNAVVPIPPLEEQNRIVEKLEQILPLIADLS